MKKRQIIIILIAAVILFVGKLTKDFLATPKERAVKEIKENITIVFTDLVKNDTIPIFVEVTGSLEAEKRIELFSEVQGIMEPDNGKFKAGNSFKKGDVLIRIRSNDQKAQLYAQRSTFQSTLTGLMPDLKADFKGEFPNWETYLKNFSIEKTTQELPNVESDKLESFLIGRGVYSSFHALKNLEIINAKYIITAPYDGVLIQANVDPGTVIRQNQALGVYIQPLQYELETAVDAITAERLSLGQEVELKMDGLDDKTWNGKISRLVKSIDKNSQLSTFFVSVEGEDLKEGMFLKAKVKGREVENAFEILRASLVDNTKVYLVKENKLVLKEVKVAYFNQSTAIITGLANGDVVLTKVPPASFEGMKVTVYKGDK